jgi:hypothetical protein
MRQFPISFLELGVQGAAKLQPNHILFEPIVIGHFELSTLRGIRGCGLDPKLQLASRN